MCTLEEQAELEKLEAMQEQVNLKEEGVKKMQEKVEHVKREMERAKREVQQECQPQESVEESEGSGGEDIENHIRGGLELY